MRRVLVPLDGSRSSEAIFPDARRLAGIDGELILVQDANSVKHGGEPTERIAISTCHQYLDGLAEQLQADGIRVKTRVSLMRDVVVGIERSAGAIQADAIAIATHGHIDISRILHGSTAWHVLVHSRIPVLLRHVRSEDPTPDSRYAARRRLLVPLDGSQRAESAVPLAVALASEWNAEIVLTEVIPSVPMMAQSMGMGLMVPTAPNSGPAVEEAHKDTAEYLQRLASATNVHSEWHVLEGHPLDELCDATERWGITDIVMASHGRTGIARVILGSVAYGLIHRLSLPIIVVPTAAHPIKGEVKTDAAPERLAVGADR